MRSWLFRMTPRQSPQPPSDPVTQAESFVGEAEQARGEWRAVLLRAAEMKLADARAALRDGEEAVATQPVRIAALMRQHLELRQQLIEQLAGRVERLRDRDRRGKA